MDKRRHLPRINRAGLLILGLYFHLVELLKPGGQGTRHSIQLNDRYPLDYRCNVCFLRNSFSIRRLRNDHVDLSQEHPDTTSTRNWIVNKLVIYILFFIITITFYIAILPIILNNQLIALIFTQCLILSIQLQYSRSCDM